MAEHNVLGKQGEDKAVEFLKNRNYVIVNRNWHSSHKELDIIAIKDGWLIVVEVRTRSSNYLEAPQDTVDKRKMRRIISAANHYVCKNKIDLPVRFDIISVVKNDEKWEIEHFKDAFMATDI